MPINDHRSKTIPVLLDDIKDAQQRISGKVNRTPLIRFDCDDLPGKFTLSWTIYNPSVLLNVITGLSFTFLLCSCYFTEIIGNKRHHGAGSIGSSSS